MKTIQINTAKAIFKKNGGILRTTEAVSAGIHPRTLYYLRDQGIIEQISRGIFELPEANKSDYPDLKIAAKLIPEGRLCLISALDFHGITDEIPGAVYLALPKGAWEPKISYPPIKTFRFSDLTYRSGLCETKPDDLDLEIYNPAKTIADCFKFRNQIGLEVCLEALKRALSERKASVGEILHYAKICKVTKVVKPYLEAYGHG